MVAVKHLFLAALLLGGAASARAQGVGIGTSSPDPSAVLELRSRQKGFLPPRLTQAGRDSISTPATGLTVFQTDNTPGYYYYTGLAWAPLGASGASGMSVLPVMGSVGTIPANSVAYVFVGPYAVVTITSPTQKIVASLGAPLGLTSGGPVTAQVGVCYQPAGGGAVLNFAGLNYTETQVSAIKTLNTVSATITGLAPGTYLVGLGVLNGSPMAINNNDFVNGYVLVVE